MVQDVEERGQRAGEEQRREGGRAGAPPLSIELSIEPSIELSIEPREPPREDRLRSPGQQQPSEQQAVGDQTEGPPPTLSTPSPSPSRASRSATRVPSGGTGRSGAISARGTSTKRRSRFRGWGRVSPGVSTLFSPSTIFP